MNIRKNVDYSQMYQAIDDVMDSKLSQMQLYCTIGRIVCTRSEKGRQSWHPSTSEQASGGSWLLAPEPAPDAGFLPYL